MLKHPIKESNIKDVARRLLNAESLGQSQLFHSRLFLLGGELDPNSAKFYELFLVGRRQVRVRGEHALNVVQKRIAILVFVKKQELLFKLLLRELVNTVGLDPVEKGVKPDSLAPSIPTK